MKFYESPDVILVPMATVRTLQISGDTDHWYDDELPGDDETELM